MMNGLRGLTFLLAGILFSWLLNSCTLAPPASEALIFQKKIPQKSQSTFTSPVYPSPHGASPAPFFFDPAFKNIYLSATLRPAVSEELKFARDKFSSFIKKEFAQDSSLTSGDLNIRNSNYLSLSVPIPLIRKKNVYWSLNVGVPVLGTDVTTDIGSDTYLTANLGFLDGEVIVQRKIVDTQSIGISVGGYYRAERRGFEIEDNKISLFPLKPIFDALSADRIFYNHIFGGRLNGYIPLGSKSYINFRAAPGYAVNLQKPILNVAATIWLDFSE